MDTQYWMRILEVFFGESMGKTIPQLFALQYLYWMVVLTVIGVATLANVLNKLVAAQRFLDSSDTPSMPKSIFFRAFAAVTGFARGLVYAPVRRIKIGYAVFHPLARGAVAIVCAHLALVSVLCFYKLDVLSQWTWEAVAYRAGFISIAQLPLIVLLDTKNNFLALMIGSSYERLHSLYRWFTRTLWLTATVHMGCWFATWGSLETIAVKLATDPHAIKGVVSWGCLTLVILNSLAPLRRTSHEVFSLLQVLQMSTFLLAVEFHSKQTTLMWITMAMLPLIADSVWGTLGNAFCILSHRQKMNHMGLTRWHGLATFKPLKGNVTKVTITEPAITWKPGQHVILTCLAVDRFQRYPLSISSLPSDNKLEFIIRAQGNSTSKLFVNASEWLPVHNGRHCNDNKGSPVMEGAVAMEGPYGRMRNLRQFSTVVFLAGSIGASFTMPLIRDIVEGWKMECFGEYSQRKSFFQTPKPLVKRVRFVWFMAAQNHLDWFGKQIRAIFDDLEMCRRANPAFDKELEICICVTRDPHLRSGHLTSRALRHLLQSPDGRISPAKFISTLPADSNQVDGAVNEKSRLLSPKSRSAAPVTDFLSQEGWICVTEEVTDAHKPAKDSAYSDVESQLTFLAKAKEIRSKNQARSALFSAIPGSDNLSGAFMSCGRPDLNQVIRGVVDKAEGESAVVACGPPGLHDDTRRNVSGLIRQKSAGIYLHTEKFGD